MPGNFGNLIPSSDFLNKDNLVNILAKSLRFGIDVHEGHLKRSMSQIFELGLTFIL